MVTGFLVYTCNMGKTGACGAEARRDIDLLNATAPGPVTLPKSQEEAGMSLRRRLLDCFRADARERSKDLYRITPIGLALGLWFSLFLFVPGQAMATLFIKVVTLPFLLAIACWIRLMRGRTQD